jgi:hypothetical protein
MSLLPSGAQQRHQPLQQVTRYAHDKRGCPALAAAAPLNRGNLGPAHYHPRLVNRDLLHRGRRGRPTRS